MKRITTITIFSVVMVATSCAAEVRKHRWDFEDLNEWQDDSQNSSPQSYTLTNGTLRIATRKQTWDRVKVRTTGRFGVGKYTWRVYVPAMGKGDQASIGAFLYKDDKHEVDFEIGYGKASVRDQLTATNRDLVCYCTSQGYPSSSSQFLVEREAWHTLSIEVGHGKNGDHLIKWFMDGKQVKQLQTSFGNEIVFTVHCSVENLKFIGDHIPAQENYALFDYVDFVPPKGTQKPIRASNGLGKPIEIDGGSRAEIYVLGSDVRPADNIYGEQPYGDVTGRRTMGHESGGHRITIGSQPLGIHRWPFPSSVAPGSNWTRSPNCRRRRCSSGYNGSIRGNFRMVSCGRFNEESGIGGRRAVSVTATEFWSVACQKGS
jgi:hypothetical protein